MKNLVPYTVEELLAFAQKAVGKMNVPASMQDDAIQEYVIAAMAAPETSVRNPRAHQRIRGRGAITDWLRHEIMMEELAPRGCSVAASRVLLDMPVEGMDGEPTTLAETIKDRQTPDPDAGLLEADRKAAVSAALARLEPDQLDAAVKVWVEGMTQEEAAETLGRTRDAIRTSLKNAKRRLGFMLQEYKSEYNRKRQG